MKINFDRSANAGYIQLVPALVKGGIGRTIAATPTINLDLDHAGHLVGIEVLDRELLPATCFRCFGAKGGAPGNENWVGEELLCDYCHAEDMRKGYDPYAEEFRVVLRRLEWLRGLKVKQYGTARYEIRDPLTNRWLCYSDVLRKFIRLQQLMLNGDIAGLLETYDDLAAYALMAVQILSREEK